MRCVESTLSLKSHRTGKEVSCGKKAGGVTINGEEFISRCESIGVQDSIVLSSYFNKSIVHGCCLCMSSFYTFYSTLRVTKLSL